MVGVVFKPTHTVHEALKSAGKCYVISFSVPEILAQFCDDKSQVFTYSHSWLLIFLEKKNAHHKNIGS